MICTPAIQSFTLWVNVYVGSNYMIWLINICVFGFVSAAYFNMRALIVSLDFLTIKRLMVLYASKIMVLLNILLLIAISCLVRFQTNIISHVGWGCGLEFGDSWIFKKNIIYRLLWFESFSFGWIWCVSLWCYCLQA